MESTTAAAPSDRWSLESWFSAFGAPDYLAFKDELTKNLTARSDTSADAGGGLAAAWRRPWRRLRSCR